MTLRASFRGTIWELPLRRVTQIQEEGSENTVECPVLSCRIPYRFFKNPRTLRKHAHTYHSDTFVKKPSLHFNNTASEDFNDMHVDTTDVPRSIEILNPALRTCNTEESFLIEKHEDNPDFQVKTNSNNTNGNNY